MLSDDSGQSQCEKQQDVLSCLRVVILLSTSYQEKRETF